MPVGLRVRRTLGWTSRGYEGGRGVTPSNGTRDRGCEPPRVPGFAVGRWCGAGASAHVFVARRDRDGLACALKVERAAHRGREAFLREAEVLTRVRAVGLIRLHEALGAEDGLRVLALELCGGGALRELIAARGHLVPRETVGVLRRVASALAALHEHGYAHGDVCAGNVLVDAGGAAVLADLGRARIPGGSAAAYGTDGYLAPELTWGAEPTPAADLYALGALGWAMLTGVVPDDLPIEEGQLSQVSGCPTPLREAILRALAPDPTRRPRATELLEALEAAGAEEPLALPDGPDLGGALTRRIRGARGSASDPGGCGVGGSGVGGSGVGGSDAGLGTALDGNVLLVGGSPSSTGDVGRHRASGSGEEKLPRALRLLAAATGPRARAAAALALGVVAGLGCWAGLEAWRDAREIVAGSVPAPPTPTTVPAPEATVGSPAGTQPSPGRWGTEGSRSGTDVGADTHEATSREGSPNQVGPPDEKEYEAAGGQEAREETGPRGTPEAAGPREALRDLLRRRALAYAQADPSVLDGVYVLATPVHGQARAEVDQLRDRGLRYEGLAYAVRRVDDRTVGPVSSAAPEAQLVAVVDTGPYRVVEGALATNVPGRRGAPTLVTLRRVGEEWRIAAVQASGDAPRS